MSTREIIADTFGKLFDDFQAVKEVSFKVRAGEISGFPGANGVGNSTTVSMLATWAALAPGHAIVRGYKGD